MIVCTVSIGIRVSMKYSSLYSTMLSSMKYISVQRLCPCATDELKTIVVLTSL